MDERRARRGATQAGFRTLGLVGLLVAAKHQGLIDAIRPLLEMLLAHGFRLSEQLVADALADAGEATGDVTGT
jgi:predicted nucleic acid-binding protein